MNTEDFIFQKVEGGYCLTDYTGKEKEIDCVEIPECFLDEPVVELGENAFWKAMFIKKVQIPSTVTKLGARCFWSCESLEEITIPDSVTGLGRRVFDGCKSLQSVTLPSRMTEIPSGLFQYCPNLEKIHLPDPVTVVGEAAFFHCHSLTEVRFSQSLKMIKAQAFERCYRMTRIQFPETLRKIGDLAFSGCYNLVEINFQQWGMVCEANTFAQCTYIEKAPLVLMKYLEKEPQNQLGQDYFYQFDRLSSEEKALLLANVKNNLHLQKFLFTRSNPEIMGTLLRNQVHPTLEEVDFYLAQSISHQCVEINAMLLNFKEHHFSQTERNAYQERKELLEMGFDYPMQAEFAEKWAYKTLHGGVYIMGYKGVQMEVEIPSRFGEGREVVGLMKGNKHDYSTLEHIVMESGIKYIGKSCFMAHFNLKTVELPPTLLTLEEKAFLDCSSLEEIRIPASVEYVGSQAFAHCSSLREVILLGNPPDISIDAFEGCEELMFVGEENGENRVDEFEIW